MAVIVMGVSGTGKSTLGAVLAQQFQCPFLEGDAFHDEAAIEKMRSGHPLDDQDRWPWLDRLGRAVGGAAAAHGTAVAACSALKRSYRDRLVLAASVAVRFALLDVGRAELLRRMGDRPGHYMPASLLDSQLATLEPPGPDEPATRLDPDRSPEEQADDVLRWLEPGADRVRG